MCALNFCISILKVTEQQIPDELPLASSLSMRMDSDYDVHPTDHESASAKLAGRVPRFEDASGHSNVTVQLGGTAFLNCRVMDLQDKTVRCFYPFVSYVLLSFYFTSRPFVNFSSIRV